MNTLQKTTLETLPTLFYKDQPVILTESLASVFKVDLNNLQQNYKRNKDRFEEGKHFFKLVGNELRLFRGYLTNCQLAKIELFAPHLMLWTERGSARHAKMINTDTAWEIFEQLEDAYFNMKDSGFIKGTSIFGNEKRLDQINKTYFGALKLARGTGSKGTKAMLKAAEYTKKTIGVDVFEYLGTEAPTLQPALTPNNYPEEARLFFEAMDTLLKEGKIKDHGDKVEVIWMHMPTAMPVIEEHLGRNFNKNILYHQLKDERPLY